MNINWPVIALVAVWLACGIACLGTHSGEPLYTASVFTVLAYFGGAFNED